MASFWGHVTSKAGWAPQLFLCPALSFLTDVNLYLVYIWGRIPRKQCDATMISITAMLFHERIPHLKRENTLKK